MMAISSYQRVVLIGFLGSGKSRVGSALARRLGWGFIDFDEELKQRERRSIRTLINESGEEHFRALQEALTAEAADMTDVVIAPGGAWILQPHLLSSLGSATLSVWLQVSPSEAFNRIRASPDDHPWRDDPDPVDRIGDLMREREELYRLADLAIPSNQRSPELIAFEIEQIIRLRGVSAR